MDSRNTKTGKSSHFNFEAFSLSDYGPATIVVPRVAIKCSDIEARMVEISKRFSTYRTENQRPVRTNDTLLIKVDSTENGRPFAGLSSEGVVFQLGKGTMPEAFEEKLLGINAGESRTINFSMPLLGRKDEKGNIPEIEIESKVTVLEIRSKELPAITDEWVRSHIEKANSVNEWRNQIRTKMIQDKRKDMSLQAPYLLLDEMAQRLVGPLPDEYVNAGIKTMHLQFNAFLEEQNLTEEDFLSAQQWSEEQLSAQLRFDAREMVVNDIVLSSYARHHKLSVSETEINEVFDQISKERTIEARNKAIAEGSLGQVEEQALRKKALRHIMRSAICIDENGNEDDDFHKLIIDILDQESVVAHFTSALGAN